MQLQKYVTEIIEALGGIVEPVEYALCHVIVPPACDYLFHGKTEVELAFDFEVAEEHPDAEFVTFGSYVFEQLHELVKKQAVCAVRFADVETPRLHNALDKIRRFLTEEHGTFVLKKERTILGAWVAFAFRISYVSDEKEEQFAQVWVDLVRGTLCDDMQRQHQLLPYKNEPVELFPVVMKMELPAAFLLAYAEAKQQAEHGKGQRVNEHELGREMARIEDYYAELFRDTQRRSQRKGLSEQKKQELQDKLQAIGLEKEKQLLEMTNKYSVRTEAALDHGMLYFAPLLEYTIGIQGRQGHKEIIIHYNPATKKFTRHAENLTRN